MDYLEAKRFADKHVCGECGGEIVYGPWGSGNELLFRCGMNKEHQGLRPLQTATALYRQGNALPIHTVNQIQRRGIESQGIHRAVALVMTNFPRAELTPGEASLFLLSCMRIGLDPLYGEAVPVPFKDSSRETRKVEMVITEVGWLSMAARACPHKWVGPPNVTPITDADFKEQICGDRDAWVWEATGVTSVMPPGYKTTSYGVFTQADYFTAKEKKQPSAKNPSNQARVRAIKKWVMENFAEAKALMMEQTGGYLDAIEGKDDVLALIDTEYNVEDATVKPRMCSIHNKQMINGKFGWYCPTKVPGPKGKETYCKGVALEDTGPRKDSAKKDSGPITIDRFYDIAINTLRYTSRDQVHSCLGVDSMELWSEPLETALDQLATLQGKTWRQ